jgi:hypothetical protein
VRAEPSAVLSGINDSLQGFLNDSVSIAGNRVILPLAPDALPIIRQSQFIEESREILVLSQDPEFFEVDRFKLKIARVVDQIPGDFHGSIRLTGENPEC